MTPEDRLRLADEMSTDVRSLALVIAKLEWAAASGSDRQLDDVAGILAITPDLDLDYIDRWTRALGLDAAWRGVRTSDA